jgi:hypothetical protein
MALEWKSGPGMEWVYASLFVFGAGFVVSLVRDVLNLLGKRGLHRLLTWAAWGIFVAACALSITAWFLRWVQLEHPPLRGMFDVFVTMAAVLIVVGPVARFGLKIGYLPWDFLLGAAILFPPAFVSDIVPMDAPIPPPLQTPLFIPHVMFYMFGYVMMAKAVVPALETMVRPAGSGRGDLVDPERSVYRMICFGFPPITAGLLLGSWWGKYSWGDFWGWDPKEIWGLMTWIVYLIYFHWRYMYGRRWPRINAALAILGLVAIVMTLVGVSRIAVFRGVHYYGG